MKNALRYKLFGTHTGLRVSELVLGTANFGTAWGHGTDPDEARRIIDSYADAGVISSTARMAIRTANPRKS